MPDAPSWTELIARCPELRPCLKSGTLRNGIRGQMIVHLWQPLPAAFYSGNPLPEGIAEELCAMRAVRWLIDRPNMRWIGCMIDRHLQATQRFAVRNDDDDTYDLGPTLDEALRRAVEQVLENRDA